MKNPSAHADQAKSAGTARSKTDPGNRQTARANMLLQRTLGNRALAGLLQAKLKLGPPGDRYEQEADQVADQVVSMSEPANLPFADRHIRQDASTSTATPLVQRQQTPPGGDMEQMLGPEDDQELTVQAKRDLAAAGSEHENGAEIESRLHRGGGNPMADEVRDFFEPRMQSDFNNVKVHTDADAARMNQALSARAFAYGDDIYFGAGEYAPETTEGKRLLAHELTHVVQQQGARSSGNAVNESTGRDVVRRQIPVALDELTKEQVKAAKDMAKSEGLGKEAILALQQELGVSSKESGEYDDETVTAVYKQQLEWRGKSKDKIKNPGFASPAEFRRLGLIFTKSYVTGATSDDVLDTISKRATSGATAAIYANYAYPTHGTDEEKEKAAANNAEFKRAATRFAEDKDNMAVGLVNGTIELEAAMPIASLGEVIELVQGAHLGLVQAYRKQHPESKDEPDFTKFKNLALFAHGHGAGVALSDKDNYDLGLHSNDRGTLKANVDSFVAGLSGALTNDVRVQLFACNVARSPTLEKEQSTALEGAKEKTTARSLQVQGATGGADSLPATLATALGGDASVYAHLTAAHTTENFAARAFGKDAGSAPPRGVHTFDLMYDETFIQTQLKVLLPDAADSSDAASATSERARLHDPLRAAMWTRYVDLIEGEQARLVIRYNAPFKEKAARTKLKKATDDEKSAKDRATKDKKEISAEDAKKMKEAIKTAEADLEAAIKVSENPPALLYPKAQMGIIMFADRDAKTKFQKDWDDYWTEAKRSSFLKKNTKPEKKQKQSGSSPAK